VALAPRPDDRFRMNVRSRELVEDEEPLVEGCPCPACTRHTRAYIHYLARAEELTAVRLLTLHNLTYLEQLVRGARTSIETGRYDEYRRAGLSGAAPWDA
jgi:queuine tRNA-ribosyltransferase